MSLRHLDRYNAYRANNEEKSLALFKVLMNGPAAVWLESLPNTATIIRRRRSNNVSSRQKS